MKRTLKKVRETICKYDMIRQGDRVVVAVSGGADSVCLLEVLFDLREDLGIELVAAHFNHGLRPGEDDAETRFVEALARALDLPLDTERARGLSRGSGSLEEKAREARYRFLNQAKQRYSAQKIALGHTLNDQAETFLMRLLRGSGRLGLSGIPPVRGLEFVRPLIGLTREEVMAYLSEKSRAYVMDSSNLEDRHLRNRIRLDLMPLLREYQPKILQILGQTADIMREDEAYLTEQAESWVAGNTEKLETGEAMLPIGPFLDLPGPLRSRAVRQILKTMKGNLRRIGRCHIEAVYRIAASNLPQRRVHLPGGVTAAKVYDKVVFADERKEIPKDYCYVVDGPGTFKMKDLGWSISLEEMDPNGRRYGEASRWTAFLDADRMSYPLIIRNFRAGDRFVPYGMSGHKKVKDFFMERKVPSDLRATIPILAQGNRVVWICGFRIDDRFKITPDTEKILKVTIHGMGVNPGRKGLSGKGARRRPVENTAPLPRHPDRDGTPQG
jgi:tRNA(Ile)-lysidine synthase